MNRLEVEKAARALLIAMGRDVQSGPLVKTPERVAKAWAEMLGGYQLTAEQVTRTTDGDHFDGEGYDQAVVMRDIGFTSVCEHHMLPFHGHAHIAYIPKQGGRVLGASKLVRLVDMHARRLQIQERMTRDIAHDLERVIEARGVAVVVKAAHLCMSARGVRSNGAAMVTSEVRGLFKDDQKARNEFLRLAGV